MKKRELELVLRAAGRIAEEGEFYLIGSQAVHAYCRRPPAEVLLSQECDLYPRHRPETANLIDAELGRDSDFAREHGFYADVVTPAIACLTPGWEKRLQVFRAGKIKAFCLEPHDLIVSKLAAGRLKDLEFTGALFRLELADPRKVRRRIGRLPMERDRERVLSRLAVVMDDLNSGGGLAVRR